jgi:hypothetical protein
MTKIKLQVSYLYNSEQYNDIILLDYVSINKIKSKITEIHPGINLNKVRKIKYDQID